MSDTLWARFLQTVDARADAPAIRCGRQVLTFEEWRLGAIRVGIGLQRSGLRHGDRVLLWTQPSIDMAVSLLGVWAAGGIAVLLDPSEPPGHLAHALRWVRPHTLIVDDDSALPSGLEDLQDLPVVRGVDAARGAGDAGCGELVAVPVTPTDAASIVFTSGSTGPPKGVTQSQRNLVRGCEAVAGYLGLAADDKILCPIPWAFDYGYGQLLSSIVIGATHVLPTALNPFEICAAIAEHRPTVFPGIPSLFTYLLRGVSPLRDTDVSSVRLVTNTGGTLHAAVLEELGALFGGAAIVLNYGLTETYRTSYLDPQFVATRPTSIGRGIPGVEVVVVRDDGAVAEAGEVGEIVHRGEYICMGYWNDPAATAKAIRPDPLAPPDCPDPPRAFYTGDLGSIDDSGFLYYVGRRDRQLKSMGVRVSPGEVEEILYESGLVREVAVFGVSEDIIGDEIWAALVPALPSVEADMLKALRKFTRARMSPYMLPRRYMVLEALPKTRTGKIDYCALERQATTVGV